MASSTALPCRHREELPDFFLCRSPKLVGHGAVTLETCDQCQYRDHEHGPEPAAPALRLRPCAHLGEQLPEREEAYACRHPSHGSTTLVGCRTCPDYLFPFITPTTPKSEVRQHVEASRSAQPHGWWTLPIVHDSIAEAADEFLKQLPPYPEGLYRGRGVVILGGGKYFPSVYITVRALCFVGCQLPIRIYYFGDSNEMPKHWKDILAPFDVTFGDLDDPDIGFSFPPGSEPKNMTERAWAAKVRAVLDAPFQEVLYLDADCYPCRNPEFLFDTPDYHETGAIFWHNRVGEIQLWWEAFRTTRASESSIEAGQFIVDKRTSWAPLQLGWWYARYHFVAFRWGYGDMHACFDVPWTKLKRRYTSFAAHGEWASIAYRHVGPDGQAVFIHRIRDKFRMPGADDWMSTQFTDSNIFFADLPLETETFAWMAELARRLGLHSGLLNLGCGRRPLLGADNHDASKHAAFVDHAFDLNRRPWPLPDSQFETIVADHVIGSLGDVSAFFDEANRILKPGGRLSIKVSHWLSEATFKDPHLLWSFKPDAIKSFVGPQPQNGTTRWHLSRCNDEVKPNGRDLIWELIKSGPGVFADAGEILAKAIHDAEAPLDSYISTSGEGRITVATLYTPEIKAYGELTANALRSYTQAHGYRSVVAAQKLDPDRPAQWSKLVLVDRVMQLHPDCEWVVWIDSDAIITEPDRSLEEFIDPDIDFLVSDDPFNPINSGVFFARNCDAVREFFRRTYAKTQYLCHKFYEQRAMEEALEENGSTLRYKIVQRRRFNSFWGEHRLGDFILHFAGCSAHVRLAGVREVLDAHSRGTRISPKAPGNPAQAPVFA